MKKLSVLVSTLLALCAAVPAHAQAFRPERPVTLVVGFSAGGSVDKVARETGHRLSKKWGQTVVVENRSGASGAIAAASVASANPDGLRLLVGPVTLTMLPAVQKDLPFDLEKDLAPVGMIGQCPVALVISNKLQMENLDDFLAYAKSQSLFAGTTGIGAIEHFGSLLLTEETGIKLQDIAYRGGPELLVDLMENRINMSMSSATLISPHAKAGRIKVLAVTGEERSSSLPEVPTFSEQGIDGMDINQWWGLFAPMGTPQEIIEGINADLNDVLQDPGLKEAFATEASVPTPMAVAEFSEYVSQQQAKWESIIQRTGIQAN